MGFFSFFKKNPPEGTLPEGTFELRAKGAKKYQKKEEEVPPIETSSLTKLPDIPPKAFSSGPAKKAFNMIKEMYNQGILTINQNENLLKAYYKLPVTETKNGKKIERALFIMFVGLEKMDIEKLVSLYNRFINLTNVSLPIGRPTLILPNDEQFEHGVNLPLEVMLLYFHIKKGQPDFSKAMNQTTENVSEAIFPQLLNFASKTPDTTSQLKVATRFPLSSDTVKAIQTFLKESKQIAAPAPSVTPSSSSSSSSSSNSRSYGNH